MYFPYLRARQFELIALRELVQEGGILKDSIMPVLEPVRKGLNNLDLVNKVFVENQFPVGPIQQASHICIYVTMNKPFFMK